MRDDIAIERLYGNAIAIGIILVLWIVFSSYIYFSVKDRPSSDLFSYLVNILFCFSILLNWIL